MLTTLQGRYRQGIIEWDEPPPDIAETQVIVTFLPPPIAVQKTKRPLGLAPDCGQKIPVDFDAPLPDEILNP